ncbi:uncharacterized protein LOC111042107, partial [Myzus persicae]|uniref:uncharacterized protein LOC111042107 n=1 Tax=Myzus persicae TaxID=13164 RepID=UPI000B9397F9
AYFSLNSSILGLFIHLERPYWTGNGTAPQSKSFLEPEKISETSVVFHMVVLVCAVFGFLTSIVLLIGIYFDLRVLFVPWIFAIIIATTVDVTHSIYLYGNNTPCTDSWFQEWTLKISANKIFEIQVQAIFLIL